ncbi:agmatine deiminase [Tistlia consotensis]|uniref:Putative agmatine deiminase n=1 Tax=Tistlia consotensis USBA 355 TaxID=560819 RepID=A0A1Y6BNW1_9PROT|nr:agmatine deiminase family protein [Tistlia consotensis]SMF21775.1 agmatine deiminase [Tistlia consotensis USBA 355]SNR46581.1 agmatine deiminase [Tistlia consotensis]
MAGPVDDGFYMPAEWAPHARTWMAWPTREALWGEHLDAAREAYAEVARAIARFEPVTMIANPVAVAEASIKCGAGVGTMPMDHDDSWLRDSGPTFLVDGKGGLAGVDWVFNAWGERYRPYAHDARVAAEILARGEVRRYACDLVTEGGAIHVDGEGTLLAVRPTLLNDNRNPGRSVAEIERLLCSHTGASKIIWLPEGLVDDETDGHVDNVACFIGPARVLVQTTDDPDDANYERLQANRELLQAETDARGRPLEVVEVRQPKARYQEDGTRLGLSYVNFYFANGGVVLPSFDDPADDRAFDLFEELFPDRKIVQVPALDILHGGGGIHCITQQQPAVEAPAADKDDVH